MPDNVKYDVFLSHNSKDKDAIITLARRLKDEGLSVWLDIWKLRVGKPWQDPMEKAIRESGSILIFIGESGFGRWENEEMRVAVEEQVRDPNYTVIPILLPGGKEEYLNDKPLLRRNVWVDYRKGLDDSEAFYRLLSGIRGQDPEDYEDYMAKRASPDASTTGSAGLPFSPAQSDKEKKAEPDLLTFVNREDLIEFILSSQSPAYHLLDAPAGFGKTFTLKKLQLQFEAYGWVNGYVAVQHQNSLNEVLLEFATLFGLHVDGDISGENFAQALLTKWDSEFQSERKKGIVLLVDAEKPSAMSLQIIRQMLTEGIPPMARVLHEHKSLKKRHNPFRVVVASRYLSSKLGRAYVTHFTPHKLTPFSYPTVRQAVEKYLAPHIVEKLDQLTAHLIYYTGGHPGCIASILALYKQKHYPDPDLFFETYEDQVWDIVYPEIDDVRISIEQDLRQAFDELSVFRFVDAGILREVIKSLPFLELDDEFELQDKLREAYLMDALPGGMFLKDGITRNMLALRLFASGGRKAFVHKCRMPQEICKARLSDPAAQLPAKWLVESYYQYLQKYIGDIQSGDTRKRLQKEFFNKIIPDGLSEFAQMRQIREHRMAIEQALDEDWEFQFTVNYFLRESEFCDSCSNSPYVRAKAQILAFFR